VKEHAAVTGGKALKFMFGFVKPLPLYLFAIFLYTSQSFVFPLISSVLMGGLTRAITGGGWPALYVSIAETMAFLLLAMATCVAGILLFVRMDLSAVKRMQTKLFRNFIDRSVEGRVHSGAALASMNTDAQRASGVFDNELTMLLMQLLPLLIFGAALFAVSWKIGAFTAGVGLLSMWAQSRFSGPLGRLAEGSLSVTAKATQTVGDIFSGGIVIRAFRLEERVAGVFGEQNGEILRLGRRAANLTAAQKLVTGVSSVLMTGGIFALGSLLISRGELSLVALMALVPICEGFGMALSQIGAFWAAYAAPLAAAKRVYAALDGSSTLEPLREEIFAPGEHYQIELEHLDFTYQGAETPALVDVSLRIGENEFVAFVGESGSGKSTLLKVIAGFYERELPGLSLGGKAFDPGGLDAWRANFAYVDQSCTLFNMTVGENIALGRDGATPEEVKAAAVEADADGFISAFPQGYDTPAGELGGSLSGGQRQRIAIARALLRGAPVLVFDEATSALDQASETEVTATINRLRGGRTVLMATHNLAVLSPDRVYRAEGGRITKEL